MNMTRNTWTLVGWLLLFFGGWSYQAHAQEVPSKDVGRSTYFVPVFPGGQVNVYPYMGNFRYTLPLFKTSGVGPCTSFTLTYDTNNVGHEDGADSAKVVSTGWQFDYSMRVKQDPTGTVIKLYLPWGGNALGVTEAGQGSATYNVTFGFGFTGQITRATSGPYQWGLQVVGGRQYLFNFNGSLATIVDPTGNRTDIVWKDGYRPLQVIDMVQPGAPYPGTGRVTRFEYYDDTTPIFKDYMKAVIDPAGNRYDLSYGTFTGGIRLSSVLFPPVMVAGTLQRPNHKFEYNTLGTGLMSKVIPPRGVANGNYGYLLEYNISQLIKVTDPLENFMDENGVITATPQPTFELQYFGNPAFQGTQYQHTTVKDRRGQPTVYVFHTTAMGPANSLLSEIWDATMLTGVPTPGIFPILTSFDPFYNLIGLQDKWGNVTTWKFVPPAGPIGNWQKNRLESVTKPGPSGPTMVEQYTYSQDVFSNVLTHTTWTGSGASRTTRYDYDNFGRQTFIHHPDVTSLPNATAQTGIVTQFIYDTIGFLPLKQIINERGNSIRYSNFDSRHGFPQDEVRDGGSQPFQKQYDVMGNLIKTKLPQGAATNDLPDWVETNYDSHYRVDTITEMFNGVRVIKLDNDYDLDGNLISVKQAGDATTPAQAELMNFDKRRLPTGGNGPEGPWTQTPDANGNIRVKTSRRGFATTIKYDKINRKTEIVAPGGSTVANGGGGPSMTTTFGYDLGGQIGNTYDEVRHVGVNPTPSRVTKTYFDERRRVRETWLADGRTKIRFKYDLQDQLLAKEQLYDDIVQRTEVLFRDERDRVFRQRVQSDAYTAGATPAAASDVVMIRNTVGTVVEERDSLWSAAAPAAHRIVHTVDARERIVATKDGLGVTIKSCIFGDDDKLIELKEPDPATKSTSLVTKETYRYTARKELKEAYNRSLVRTVLNTYRVREGFIDTFTDAANVVTQTTYYPHTWRVNEVITAPGAADQRKVKSVWTNGLLTQTQVWNSTPGQSGSPSVYRYSYDQADRLELFEYPGALLAPEQNFYSEFSEVSQLKAQSRVCNMSYDALGRLKSSAWSGPVTESFNSEYDELGNLSSVFTTVPPSTAVVRRVSTSYTKWLGMADTQTFSIGTTPWQGSGPTLDYTYNSNRQLTAIVDKEGGQHRWAYDACGRLQSTSYGPTAATIKTVCSLTYTPGGLLNTTTLYDAAGAPVAVTTHTYDGRGRKIRQRTITSVTRTVVADLQWQYDDRDLVTKISFTHLGVETSVGYNARREVTSESNTANGSGLTPPPFTNSLGAPASGAESAGAGPATARTAARLPIAARSATYVIDPAGNRISQTVAGVQTTFTYNAASQLKTELRGASAPQDKVTHNYDSWGNETSRLTDLQNNGSTDTNEQFQYNALNRLRLYTNSSTLANWQYDFWPSGDRACKTNNSTNVKEHYIPRLGDVVADYQQTGSGTITLKNKYVQGVSTDSKQLRIDSALVRRHYIGDAVGTLGATLDDAAVVQEISFKDVFGVQVAGATAQERYSGIAQRERDTESGLDYVRARMYDPRTGRFTQTDPVLGNRPVEHYIYASNNPIIRVDPWGLQDHSSLQEVNDQRALKQQAPISEEEWARMNNKSLGASNRLSHSKLTNEVENKIIAVNSTKGPTVQTTALDEFFDRVHEHQMADGIRVTVVENWEHVAAKNLVAYLLGLGLSGPAAAGVQNLEKTALTKLEQELARKAQIAIRRQQAFRQAAERQAAVLEKYGLKQGSALVNLEKSELASWRTWDMNHLRKHIDFSAQGLEDFFKAHVYGKQGVSVIGRDSIPGLQFKGKLGNMDVEMIFHEVPGGRWKPVHLDIIK